MGSRMSAARQKAASCCNDHALTAAGDLDEKIYSIPPAVVYKDLPAVEVHKGSASPKTRQLVDAILWEKIATAEGVKSYKPEEKKAYLADILQAAFRAIHCEGCIRHPLKPGRDGCTKLHIQVLKAMVKVGLLREVRSPPGSPMMSRYLPLSALRQFAFIDPWDFDDRPRSTQYVFLRCREDKANIDFNSEHPTAKDVQRRLELVNEENGRHAIICVLQDTWGMNRSPLERTKQLRPVHYAIFTGDLDHHGRLYTGEYGHQSLRKSERETIRFDGQASVEVDYRGMHCLMLYHLEGIDYLPDPYALWGKGTTGPQRLMAKKLINAAINAGTKDGAISACNFAMCTCEKDDEGRKVRKHGKELEDAFRLQQTADKTGLKFSQIYPLALEQHRRIRRYFGCDMGLTLMRHDSAIALDILHHFATRHIPCLGVHDSFIVPERYEADLRRAMMRYYKQRLGFLPILS
jgi:hypothetical protein